MKREIIWNLSLIVFGIFLVFVSTIFLSNQSFANGLDSNSLFPPFGFLQKVLLGLIGGVILIIFRYLHVGMLSIANKDLRLIVLLMGYSVPILFFLIGLNISADTTLKEFKENIFPIQQAKKSISELRKVGMFNAYSDKSDEFVTDLVIGRIVSKENGWINSGQYWDCETNEIYKLEILKLDIEKVLLGEVKEFSVEGEKTYKEVIIELAKISEGNFKPTEIKENWKSEEEVILSFKNENKEHIISPKVLNNWADMKGVIRYLNKEIFNSVDYKFYYGTGEEIFVIGLTQNEKEKLSKLIGIKFEEIQ